MYPVTMCNFNTTQCKMADNKVSFSGGPKLMTMDDILTLKSCQLVKRAGSLLDETWKKVKKQKPMTIPELVVKKNGETITLKPFYNLEREAVLLEVKGDKYVEKVLIDRVNPNKFRYEKSVKTDYGSATIKTFNSQNDKNRAMVTTVNDLIEYYLPKFVPELPVRKHHKI